MNGVWRHGADRSRPATAATGRPASKRHAPLPTLIAIQDPGDPRIADYRDVRERDLIGRAGLFVAEGKVVVEKVIASDRHRLHSLLIAAKRAETLGPILSGLPADVPVYVAAQPVLDAVAGFPIHRGIIGLGTRNDNADAETLLAALPEKASILLLSAIANHDNIGGIFRNAAAFGIDAILLDADCCDPLYRKAIRVSVGAALLVRYARLDRGTDPLALLDRHGFESVALSPTGTILLADWQPSHRTAVMLGAEGPGLAPAIIARTKSVGIEMAAGFDSLNVATTSGIVLHHLAARSAAANRRDLM